jgi:hypothetical protein
MKLFRLKLVLRTSRKTTSQREKYIFILVFRLVTFVCKDMNYYNLCSEHLSLNHEHFRLLLTSENISIRCNAAFQVNLLFSIEYEK